MSDVDDTTLATETDQKDIPKERQARKHGDPKPCERCRSQHLKCVYSKSNARCQRCERSDHACVKSTMKIKFRDVPASRFRNDKRARRATSLSSGSKTSQKVDNTATEEVQPSVHQSQAVLHDPDRAIGDSAKLSMDAAEIDPTLSPFQKTKAPITSLGMCGDVVLDYTIQTSNLVETNIPDANGPAQTLLPTPSTDRFSLQAWQEQRPLTRVLSSDRDSNCFGGSPFRHGRRVSSFRYLNSLVKPQSGSVPQDSQIYLENVLLRYFHEELAQWFDPCDPDRHFATVLPQKAREPGPLRSALLTIAGRNLSRNKRFRNSAGIVEWRGRLLPNLTEEFAVPYHQECIQDLLSLSLDPKKLHDETLLAAVLALRTDEEMGVHSESDENDQQVFLRVASVFIDAQLPSALALPHSSPEVFPSMLGDEAVHSNLASPSVHSDDLGASGLRQALYWTQFRQDLHAAFLRQQPVRFPLSRCGAFRQLTPATDAVWANRMVTFCADVLEFSYGSDSSDGKVMPMYTNHDKWRELRDREQMLCSLLPATFEPTFCTEPDQAFGVFPDIWYLDPCHVSGTTYIELARMLLEVFNPTRPKLGNGFLAATNAFIISTKKILIRLCGIALSNYHCPPSLINACLGISMFGEYFDDPVEQDALLGVLAHMHNWYAYPTTQIAQSLRRAWDDEQVNEVSPVASFNHMDTG